MFAVITFLCWFGISVIRLYGLSRPNYDVPARLLWAAHAAMQSQGALNAIVFSSYSSVRCEYYRVYQGWRKVEKLESASITARDTYLPPLSLESQ